MKRMFFTIFVISVVLGVAVLAGGKATHLFYTTDSMVWMFDSPFDFVTHEANGWIFLEGFPIYGNYQRHYDGETDSGALLIEVKGKASLDGADGNFEGPVSLYIDGMDCVGRFRNKRVDFYESGSWVLQCPDGSKIQDTYQFIFTPPVSAVEGSGRMLTPHG